MLDDVDVVGVADGPGLLEVEEVADELVLRKGRCTHREAHEAFTFCAAERSKELMAVLLMDEPSQTATSLKC